MQMSWKKVKIGSFLKERTGRFKPAEANKMGLKRIEKIDFSGTYHLVEKVTNTDMVLVKKGDLLISGINAEKGAVTVYDNIEDALATIHYSSYSFDETKMDVEYFRWFLISDAFKNLLKASAGGGIKTELKAKHLLPLEIYLPALSEQKKIIQEIKKKHKKVSEIQSVVEQQQTHLQLLRQAILQEAVQGKLTQQNKDDEPADKLLQRIKVEKQKLIAAGKLKKEKELPPITAEEIPFELPKGWVWCRLGEIVSLITKGSSPKWQGVEYIEDGLLFVTSENVDSYKIDLTKKKYVEWKFNEIEPRSILKKGDFLMNIVGGSIGRTAVYDLDEVANINQAVCLIRKETKLVNSEFLLNFFNSSVCISYMYNKQVDNARPNLSMGNIEKFLIPLPPLSEQYRIVAKMQQLLQTVNELEQQVCNSQAQAQQLLQAVLKEAFSGKDKIYEKNGGVTMAAEIVK